MAVPSMHVLAAGARAVPGYDPITAISWLHSYWAEGPRFAALGLADGDPIGTWPDETGSSDLTQSTAGMKPTYRTSLAALGSKPAVDSDGGDQIRATLSAVSQPFTIVTVQEGIDSGKLGVDINGNSGWGLYNSSGKWNVFYGAGPINGGTSDTGKHLFVLVGDGASCKIIVDGTTVVTGNAGTGQAELFGYSGLSAGGFYVSGSAGFLAIASGVMGSSDLADLLAWSQDHYGTP